MIEPFNPENHRLAPSRFFEDFSLGESFYIPSRTVRRHSSSLSRPPRATTIPSTTIANIAGVTATLSYSPMAIRFSFRRQRGPASFPFWSKSR